MDTLERNEENLSRVEVTNVHKLNGNFRIKTKQTNKKEELQAMAP